MPIKNGLQCLKEIRSNEILKNISVAIYSTSNGQKDIEETFSITPITYPFAKTIWSLQHRVYRYDGKTITGFKNREG